MKKDIENLKLQSESVNSWGRIVAERLRAVYQFAGCRILDIGCAGGAYVEELLAHGYDAFGSDIMMNSAWMQGSESRYTVADINNLPYVNHSFDTIIAFEILEHLENVEVALAELRRLAKKNIILSVPNCLDYGFFEASGLTFYHWTDKTHKQFFTRKSLCDLLERNNFCVNYLTYINPIRPETLLLSAWGFPPRISRSIGSIINKLSLRKSYYMTLLAILSSTEDIP